MSPLAPADLALNLAATAQAGDPVTGEEFDSLAAGAVDVTRLHQRSLKSQMDRHEIERVYKPTLRSMKGEFVDVDGDVIEDALGRFLHTNWFGKGDPRTGPTWYAGMPIDAAVIGSLGDLVYNGQLLAFAGYASHGWQGSVSLLGDHHQGVLDDGSFVRGLRVGSEDDTGGGSAGLILSAQHVEVAAFGAVLDSRGLAVSGDRDDVVSAIRALIQPEAAVGRAGLRGVGVPSLALERIGAGLDPRSEAAPGQESPAVYQLPLSLDDLGRLGLRVRVVPELAPTPSPRLAEGSFAWIGGPAEFGGQAGAWQSSGEWSGAGEGYAARIANRQEDGDEGPAVIVSVAHNVPDPTTSFAIPDATVFGLSLTFGPPDTTRGGIPVLASQARHGL